MDKVRPLKLENPASGGTQTNLFPTEVNPQEDYLSTKGIVLEDNSSYKIDKSSTELQFTDSILGTKSPSQLKIMEIPCYQNLNPYLNSTVSTFQVKTRFVFRGTTELNAPTIVRAILQGGSASGNNEVRLFDVTNNVTLGTLGFTGGTLQISTITTSNWPANPAIIEIQLRNISGGEARISGLSLEW